MPYSNIDKPSKYFTAKTYTANASTQNITGLEFQPDFVWTKSRANAYNHNNYDAVRGATKNIGTNQTRAESTDVNSLTSFNSDGFTLGFNEDSNYTNGSTAVSWNWLAGGTGVSNTAGTISSTVSVNQTSGFSIVSYTATSGTSSIGHGLGVVPSMIILKTRNQTGNWVTGLAVNGWDKYLTLDTTNANVTDDRMFSPSAGTDPTSTLFWSNQSAIGSAGTMIAYCFAEVKGFSKFGSYTGNGSSDGTFVYTGFTPAFVMIKQTSSAGEGWEMGDNKRSTYNVITTFLRGNSSAAESTNTDRQYDFLSNGIKMRGSHGSTNGSGSTYIYMCFASNPFVSSKGIPACAR